jgi:hypothetical protein
LQAWYPGSHVTPHGGPPSPLAAASAPARHAGDPWPWIGTGQDAAQLPQWAGSVRLTQVPLQLVGVELSASQLVVHCPFEHVACPESALQT